MSKYPVEIDSDKELPSAIDGATENVAESVNSIKDAVLSIEKTIGTNPQGSESSLNARLNVALNTNGTLKSSALISAGMVALPITNSQISSSAAIAESKLDLDYSTQALKTTLNSHDVDIDQLQDGVSLLGGNLSTHVTGAGFKHYANQIILNPTIEATSNVQAGISALSAKLDEHISSGSAHAALKITYTPPVGSSLTATNVQAALNEIVDGEVGNLHTHQRVLHGNSISEEAHLTLSNQSNVNSASLATTVLTPTGGQKIIKIGQLNSATIKSIGFCSLNLTSSASNININYEDGYSEKIISLTSLHTLNSLDDFVSHLNETFVSIKAPLTAFAIGAEFAVQHNWPGYTFSFEAPISSSAAVALGISNTIGQNATISTDYYAVTNGIQRNEEDGVFSVNANLLAPSNIIELPFSLQVGALLNVQNHTADSNGVYQVISVSGSEYTLNQSVLDGYFSIKAFSDSISIGSASPGSVYEVCIDENLKVSKQLVSSITLPQLSNIQIVSCDLSPGAYSIAVTQNGLFLDVIVSSGSKIGPITSIKNGYVGKYTVLNHLNEKIVISVLGQILANQTDQFSVFEKPNYVTNQRIASFYTNGSVASVSHDLRFKPATGSFGLLQYLSYTQSTTAIITKENICLLNGKEFFIPAISLLSSEFAAGIYVAYLNSDGEVKVTSTLDAKDIISSKGIPLIKFKVDSSLFSEVLNISFKATAIELDKIYISDNELAHSNTLSGGSELARALGVPLVIENFISNETFTAFGDVLLLGECEFSQLTFSNAKVRASNISCSNLLLVNTFFDAISCTSPEITINASTLAFDSITSSQITITGVKPALVGKTSASFASNMYSVIITTTTDAVISGFKATLSSISNSTILVNGVNTNLQLDGLYLVGTTITSANARSGSYNFITLNGTLDKLSFKRSYLSYRGSFLNIAAATTIQDLHLYDAAFTKLGSIVSNSGNGAVTNLNVSSTNASSIASVLFQSGSGTFSNFKIDGLLVSGSFDNTIEPVGLLNLLNGKVYASGLVVSDLSSTLSLFELNGTVGSINGLSIPSFTSTKYLFSITNGDLSVANAICAVNSELLKGHYLTISDSDVTILKTTSSPIVINTGSTTKNRAKISNTRLALNTNSTLGLFDCFASSCQFVAGQFVFSNSSGDSNGLQILGSKFVSTKSSASVAFDFNGSYLSGLNNIISNNIFQGSPSNTLFRVASAPCEVIGNSFVFDGSVSGESVVQLGTVNTTDGSRFFSSNAIKLLSGSVDSAIKIIESNCVVSNNIVSGTFGFGFKGIGAATQIQVRCLQNSFLQSPSSTSSGFNSACLIRDNPGCEQLFYIQPFGASFDSASSWVISSNEVKAIADNAVFYIGLSVPRSQIVSVTMECFLTGSVNCSLLYRQSILASAVEIGSAASSLTGAVHDVTIAPTSYFSNENEGLMLKVTASTANSFFGNIKVKYKL